MSFLDHPRFSQCLYAANQMYICAYRNYLFIFSTGKISLQVIAERLSEEEIGGLKELFKMIDTDESGTITFEELKVGLKRVGSQLMESEIKALMDAVMFKHQSNLCFSCISYITITLTLCGTLTGRYRQQRNNRIW